MSGRSLRLGSLAAAALAVFYVAIVAAASGSTSHLVDQIRTDWYLLVLIIGGFGVQVGLLVELRRRHRFHGAAATASGAGAGASTAGMVACCAHHLADLAPLAGAAGAAAFLTDYRVPLMVTGIAVNAVGIVVSARRLRRLPHLEAPRMHRVEVLTCDAAA